MISRFYTFEVSLSANNSHLAAQFRKVVTTTSGTLSSDQWWFTEVTLTGNLNIPSGVTLTITSDATVDLTPNGNQFYIKSTGGTIINQGTINGLAATLSDGSLFSSLSAALNSASSGQTVQTIGSQNVNNSCTVPLGVTMSASAGANLTFGSDVKLSINGTLSSNGAIFQGSGTAGSWNSISFYSGSSGSIQGCTIKDAQCGIYATTGASINCSDNTITNNSLYGLSIINNSSVSISGCTISNNGTGINLSSSAAAISGNSIYNNSNYGIHAENVNANYPWENNTLEGNSGYAIFLNNTSPIFYHNMISDNGHGLVISSASPYFGLPSVRGYNAITCASTPLFRAENSSDVFMGYYEGGGGYNSVFGSELPDIEALYGSLITADSNYWGGSNAASYADGTSSILARDPLLSDPNSGSSCGSPKIAVLTKSGSTASTQDNDISNTYWQAVSKGNKNDYKSAKDLLKTIINSKFDKKYSPLSLLKYYNFSIQEHKALDPGSKYSVQTKDYNVLFKNYTTDLLTNYRYSKA